MLVKKIHFSKKGTSTLIVLFLIALAVTASFITYTYVMGNVNDGDSNSSDGTNTGDTVPTADSPKKPDTLFASFKYSSPIVNYKIRFIDTSQSGSAPITQWTWNFGDGTTSNEQNPSHVYTAVGAVTVSLTVVDSNGRSSTTTKMIYVESLRGFRAPFILYSPTVEFSVSTANPAVLEQVTFEDKSSTAYGTIISWLWNFGDGTTSDQQNPTHAYANAGVKTVTLTVIDSNGVSGTVTKSINVEEVIQFASPTADFTVSSANPTVLQDVVFTDSSTAGSGVINQWLWSFGDGTTSSQQNPTHSYSTTGSKTITLTVTDTNGKSSTITKTITVQKAPSAEFTVSSVNPTLLQEVVFTDTSVAGSGVINSWQWNFGDGATSTEQNPTHSFSAIGVKTVTLTVTDTNGKTSTVTHELTVNDVIPPTASFTYAPTVPTVGESISFTCTTIPGSAYVNQFFWDFGDGTTSSEHNPTHTYSTAGVKTVTFTVTDANGKTSTTTQKIAVAGEIWSGTAWSASDMRATYGDSVSSPILEEGMTYRIQVAEMFCYNAPSNFAADAMYYTTDASNSWDWASYSTIEGGHSFLQIDGKDVNWGAFSNGATGHTYSINYVGQGRALSFQILDWIDGNYANNYCHLAVTIYLVGPESAPS